MAALTGLTFDTGALEAIATALTRKRGASKTRRRIVDVWEAAVRNKVQVTVPVLVLAEFWRGQQARPVLNVIEGVTLEPVDADMARAMGMYRKTTGGRTGPSFVDASVVISAARRCDIVYTGDVHDLTAVVAALHLEQRVTIRGLDA